MELKDVTQQHQRLSSDMADLEQTMLTQFAQARHAFEAQVEHAGPSNKYVQAVIVVIENIWLARAMFAAVRGLEDKLHKEREATRHVKSQLLDLQGTLRHACTALLRTQGTSACCM